MGGTLPLACWLEVADTGLREAGSCIPAWLLR